MEVSLLKIIFYRTTVILLIELVPVLMKIGFQSLIHKEIKTIQGFICLFAPKLCWHYRTYVLIYNV